MPAVRTSGGGEAIGKDAAFEVAPELPFHVGRDGRLVPVIFRCGREVGLQVLLHDLVAGGLLGTATAVRDRSTSL
jgi:hypothetical protein